MFIYSFKDIKGPPMCRALFSALGIYSDEQRQKPLPLQSSERIDNTQATKTWAVMVISTMQKNIKKRGRGNGKEPCNLERGVREDAAGKRSVCV